MSALPAKIALTENLPDPIQPTLQRFISRDPIGLRGGANLYSYVGNDPMRWNDPMGLQPTTEQKYLALLNDYRKLRKRDCKHFIDYLRNIADRSSNIEEFMRLSQALFVPNGSFPTGVLGLDVFDTPDYQQTENYKDGNGQKRSRQFITRFPDTDWNSRYQDSYRHADPVSGMVDQTHHLVFFMMAGYRSGNNPLTNKFMIDAERRSQGNEPRPNRGDIILGTLGLRYGDELRDLRGSGCEKEDLHRLINRLEKRLCR